MKSIFFTPFILVIILSCNKIPDLDFKQEMRDFVIGINEYGKESNSKFIIIPQNGIELVSNNGEEDGTPQVEYLNAIDGNGQEDLFFGYDNDDQATSLNDNSYLRIFLDISKNAGKTILVTDYCSAPAKMQSSYDQNFMAGYIGYAASQRELNNIPVYPNPIYRENAGNITSLSQVKNFLYLINPENYTTKADFIRAVNSTNYDLLIIDLFFQDDTEFSLPEVNQLKNKANGGRRLVICYMSIGEAEDYRYYWQPSWNSDEPSWIDRENPEWEGNFKVKYWEQGWKNIIYGNDSSYLKRILNAGFDGVYLDIIDAFEYYE